MESVNYQDILNMLCTQANARAAFIANREQFYIDFKIIDTQVIQFLNELKTEQLSFFSSSLLSKRKQAIIDLLPLTTGILSDTFDTNFLFFSQNYSPIGIHKHHEDAANFSEYLINNKKSWIKQVSYKYNLFLNWISFKIS